MTQGDDSSLAREYSSGPMRCVTTAMNQAEAEMIQGMLRAEGIPCFVRRSG